MLVWSAMLVDSAPPRPSSAAAIELRSTAPAAELVPCIAQSLARTGAVVTAQIAGGTQIDRHDVRIDAAADGAPGFSIQVTEAGPQRVIRATYRHPVTVKLAQRLMGDRKSVV